MVTDQSLVSCIPCHSFERPRLQVAVSNHLPIHFTIQVLVLIILLCLSFRSNFLTFEYPFLHYFDQPFEGHPNLRFTLRLVERFLPSKNCQD